MRLPGLIFALALSCGSAYAQVAATATLHGRVLDPQGAVVAGARVSLRQAGGGTTRETSSDPRGTFVVPDLPPGSYVLRVGTDTFAARELPPLTLQVGQNAEVTVRLEAAARTETVDVAADALSVRDVSSVVQGVIPSRAIERLPLNGRNFLELAFLIPGNAPAPNFDPTKTNSVLVSSAGQLGRGGNVTLDGADNNDDVVGGPLQNLPQDAIEEFQIATNRFSSEIGRSGASAINVVTKSGTDTWGGSASAFLRDQRLQGLPATADRSQGAPPFDREQVALAVGGPLARGRLYWFGAAEYRNQDGALLVGERDVASRTIRRSFAPAPLDDFLGTTRLDWTPQASDRVTLRYSVERATDTGSSARDRPLGSASQRAESRNSYHSVLGSWTRVIGPRAANTLGVSFSRFRNAIDPVETGVQLTFPSFLDGASFRVPQATDQDRWQVADTFSWALGAHSLRVGGEVQRVQGAFYLGVFREGRVELVQDFAQFDLNRDGRVNDDDLLFAVTLRSGFPDRDLDILDANNTHFAGFVQDDWRVHPRLTLNLGLRYELDTDVKNVSRYDEINPIVRPFLSGDRQRDGNNWGPRIGLNWAASPRVSVHAGYGIYYDRVTLQIESLERGLDGRSLPIEVRAGNALFLDPATGSVPPFAPTFADPFTGFILPGAGAGGINIIDNSLQNPSVQQFNLGVEARLGQDLVLRVDGLHDVGTHFIIGRTVGTVFNPVVGGPDSVVNLESSVGTKYDGLLLSAEKRFGSRHWLRSSYTLAKAFNYANDDQIPFSNGPIDPGDLRREYGPPPNDQRHRFTLAGSFTLPGQVRLAPLLTLASAVPMDIRMPDGQSRIPTIQRNAGGREFKTPAELNTYLQGLNAAGGIGGVLLPLVGDDARFGDSFQSLDLRLSRSFSIGGRRALEGMVECFNVFNVTNVLGTSNVNYSGYSNVLVRDSEDPRDPGYLRSSSFGKAVTTAGGVFGSGGPRAFQLGLRLNF
jgi:hypothetical protein